MRTRLTAVSFVLVGCSFFSVLAAADEQETLKVGLQPDGRIVVPTNQILQPAGTQLSFPGRPVDLAFAADGTFVVVKNMRNLVFIDLAAGKIKQTLASPVGFSVVGLAVQGDSVCVTDVQNHLRVAKRQADGTWNWTEPVELLKPKDGKAVYPAGIALYPPNKVEAKGVEEIWVASSRGNCLQLVNLKNNQVEQTVPVGVAPYAICCPRPGRLYVSNWGGDHPGKDDPQAKSSGTDVRVDPRTGIANQGTVAVLEPTPGKWQQVKTIAVGLHPSGLVASHDGAFVYVANANSDTVSVIDTEKNEVVETIACRPESRLPFGSGTNALALSPQGEMLYVANGTNNCVAVVRLGSKACRAAKDLPADSKLAGLIPTGWYPGAILVSADGKRLIVANIKGVGSLATPRRQGGPAGRQGP